MNTNEPQGATRTVVGRRGEELACQYLAQNGFTLLHRNYRSAHQEIDIIARDDTTLIFVEVKTRSCTAEQLSSSLRYGRPARAVTADKQKNLTNAARAYLREHPISGYRMRFDVIEVYIKRGTDGSQPTDILKIHHIRSAFFAATTK